MDQACFLEAIVGGVCLEQLELGKCLSVFGPFLSVFGSRILVLSWFVLNKYIARIGCHKIDTDILRLDSHY